MADQIARLPFADLDIQPFSPDRVIKAADFQHPDRQHFLRDQQFPALAALLGGQRLITRSGFWTTRRNADRGAP